MKRHFCKNLFHQLPQEKRAKILNSAIIEFSQHGYEGANINRIAKQASISVGSMYKYFENKEHVYLEVIGIAVKDLNLILGEILDKHDNIYVIIEEILKAIQHYSKEKKYLTQLYNQMMTDCQSKLSWEVAEFMEGKTASLYTNKILEAQEEGLINDRMNPKYVAFFLDNIFVMLQFSYSCRYYEKRMLLFLGKESVENDEEVIKELMKIITVSLCHH